jgi:hypothetical protein
MKLPALAAYRVFRRIERARKVDRRWRRAYCNKHGCDMAPDAVRKLYLQWLHERALDHLLEALETEAKNGDDAWSVDGVISFERRLAQSVKAVATATKRMVGRSSDEEIDALVKELFP